MHRYGSKTLYGIAFICIIIAGLLEAIGNVHKAEYLGVITFICLLLAFFIEHVKED
jgi:hypothetical protein